MVSTKHGDTLVRFAPQAISFIAAAVLMAAAFGRHRYSYYENARVVGFLAAILICWLLYRFSGRLSLIAIATGGVALVFNPVIPFHFARSTWAWLDLLGAAIFLISGIALARRVTGSQISETRSDSAGGPSPC